MVAKCQSIYILCSFVEVIFIRFYLRTMYVNLESAMLTSKLKGSHEMLKFQIMSETISMTSSVATCMSTSHCDQQLAVQDLKLLSSFSLFLHTSPSFLISYIVSVLKLTISSCTEGTDLEEVATGSDLCSAD